jgi:hypothetical protein
MCMAIGKGSSDDQRIYLENEYYREEVSIMVTNATTTTMPVQQKANFKSTVRGLAFSIAINAVLPFVLYQVMKTYANASDFLAVVVSGLPPTIAALVGVVRKRQIDFLSGFVLISIVVGIIPVLMGGDARLLLVRESLFGIAFSAAYLGSLLYRRPMAFYFARYFATGNNEQNVAWFNGLWQYEGFRHIMRVVTIVWGVSFLLEACIRIPLVFMLSIPQFLVVSPFISYSLFGGLMAWTMVYSRRGRKRGEQMQSENVEAQHEAA